MMPARGSDMGVGDTIAGLSNGVADDPAPFNPFDSVDESSALVSYPSLTILSASSLAFFSASSKSIASPVLTFLAPSLVVFLAPSIEVLRGPDGVLAVVDFRSADDVVVLDVGGGVLVSEFSPDDVAFAPSVPAGLRNGLAVRIAGVVLREGGFEGRLIVGLSHEEKKSSAGSPDGVELPSADVGDSKSVTMTSSGNSF